jgi:hypothetical protein
LLGELLLRHALERALCRPAGRLLGCAQRCGTRAGRVCQLGGGELCRLSEAGCFCSYRSPARSAACCVSPRCVAAASWRANCAERQRRERGRAAADACRHTITRRTTTIPRARDHRGSGRVFQSVTGGRGPSQIGGALPAVHAPTCSCATFSASLVATRPAPLTAPAPAADACGAARSVERGDCQLSGVNARAQHRPPRRDGSYRPLMISMPTTV